MNRFHSIRLLAVLLMLAAKVHAASFSSQLSSQFLVRGEQTLLEFVLSDSRDQAAVVAPPEVPGLSIQPVGFGNEMRWGTGRRREMVFRFVVSSYSPGDYTIPSVTVEADGETLTTAPLFLRIFNETELSWSTVSTGAGTVRYAAAFHTADLNPFINEVLPTELKLYFPRNQRVEDWGIPEFKRDGLAAWRFQPRPRPGSANLLGASHYAISYPSTIAPTRTGPVTLGPATLRLITIQTSMRNFGSTFYQPLTLDIPTLELDARPLPDGAPAGFENAIGDFELSVSASEEQIREGDPVSLTIVVSGTGNLDTLGVPQPLDSEGWKLYPPSSPERGDERREAAGMVAFNQFMRPLRPQTQIPPFRLVFFNPDTEEYQTRISSPIPLQVLPSTSAPAVGAPVPMALPMPVEQMTDILGIITQPGGLRPAPSRLPGWSWQLFPAALCLSLLAIIAHRRLGPRLKKDPDTHARLQELRALERVDGDARSFYLAAGRFVERWHGGADDGIAREVLERRDTTCFRADGPPGTLPRDERSRILKGIRQLATCLAAAACLVAPQRLSAEEPADEGPPDPTSSYEAGRYQEAAQAWLESGPYDQLSADVLYNIGDAAYRLGAPGEAALYWRRALLRDPSHAESRQNLRFFERKFGSITFERPEHQYKLARLRLQTWKNLAWGGVWLAVVGALTFPATRAMSRWRIAAVVGLAIAPILAVAGFWGWRLYPDDARFAAPTEQAVVVADRAIVRTDAARNAPEVIEAPAGSLCRVLARRGSWTYVALTNDTRGWLPAERIEFLVPRAAPEPPRQRLLGDDGQNACLEKLKSEMLKC